MFGELPWIPFNRDELVVAMRRPLDVHRGLGNASQELMSAAMATKITAGFMDTLNVRSWPILLKK